MKTSEINKINKCISEFVMNMANYEEALSSENPKLWRTMFNSLLVFSNISAFLENAKYESASKDINFFNRMLIANGMSPLSGAKLEAYINKERDVSLDIEVKTNKEVI